jgi:hypothetical protein
MCNWREKDKLIALLCIYGCGFKRLAGTGFRVFFTGALLSMSMPSSSGGGGKSPKKHLAPGTP